MLGFPSVKQTQLSRHSPTGFFGVTNTRHESDLIWEQEPYIWEKPFRFGTTRHYKIGLLEQFRFVTDLIPNKKGTEIRIRLWLEPRRKTMFSFLRIVSEKLIKRRLIRILQSLDKVAQSGNLLYIQNKPYPLVRGADNRIQNIRELLVKETRRKRIIDHLIEYIRKADDKELLRIHPFMLAEYWGEKKYAVLNVFLHAAGLNLLDFHWDVCCPKCKHPRNVFQKLSESRPNLHCDSCDIDYEMDFNTNTHLVFKPHPLIRKISDRRYTFGDPQSTPHIVSQHFMNVGSREYLKIEFEEGTYIFKTQNHRNELVFHVREDGLDTVQITLTDNQFDQQEVTISTQPNITIVNNSTKKLICEFEKKDWKEEAVYASEVSSAHDFRTLFPREALKEGTTVKASEVTMLFTDLMNSTEFYRQQGDDTAIGQVMSHFKIIQHIVAEERGGVVKTIGDSVMAVFREPVSALKAVERIQQIFTTSSALGESFKLKAGVHYGDCTAVNLNGRTDYFGTTVNIASRLVDVAREKEITLSNEFYDHPDVRLYLRKHTQKLFIRESDIELKGFEDERFHVRQLRLEKPSLRLVV